MLAPVTAAAGPPATSEAFLQTIGVVTHMAYTDGEYNNVPQVLKDLKYLGIANVRDGISNGNDMFSGKPNGSGQLSVYKQLAAAGVKFNFLSFAGGPATTAVLNNQLNLMQQVEAATPGSVIAIEGPNEINNQTVTWNGAPASTCAEELADALALQKALYAAVKANKALSGVKVVMLTGANAYSNSIGCSIADHPNVGTHPGYADYDNQHPYPPNAEAPNLYVTPSYTIPSNTAPVVYTETGYVSAWVNGQTSVYGIDNQYEQGMYGLDLFFDAALYGVTRTYWYELMDAYEPGSPQSDSYWGYFDFMNNPKPIAIGMHNLHEIMTDTGTGPIETPAFKATGLPAKTAYTLALGRRDGSTGDFVLWNEPPLWDWNTAAPIQPTSTKVTVSLGKTYSNVAVYDPAEDTKPIQTATGVSEIVVTLTDHPLIVRANEPQCQATAAERIGGQVSGDPSAD